MTVKKVSGGFATVHCHGADKGKVIHKFETKEEAMAQHKAIEANKHKRKHHSAEDGDFLASRMSKFGVD